MFDADVDHRESSWSICAEDIRILYYVCYKVCSMIVVWWAQGLWVHIYISSHNVVFKLC